jgi:arylsulfatase A-like enzyme
LAITRLRELDRESQPFFLAVGFFKPHLPFNAPRKYWDLHDPAHFEVADDGGLVAGAPDLALHAHRELGGYRGIPEDEQMRRLRHGYYACVSYVDAQVGRLLAELRRLELDQRTIVVLWGDHGFSLGENRRWCKGTNFERDTRVPLLMRTPGMKQPGVKTEALAGLTPPEGLDGRSLVPLFGIRTTSGTGRHSPPTAAEIMPSAPNAGDISAMPMAVKNSTITRPTPMNGTTLPTSPSLKL